MRKGAKGLSLRRITQFLLTAVLAVGIVAVSPAEASAPVFKVKHMQPKQYALHLVKQHYPKDHAKQFACLHTLWTKESNWRSTAANKVSTAFGIPQFLDSTWKNYGYPVRPKDPQIQIKAGLRYIYKRYSSPCNAWDFWKKQAGQDMVGGWY